jgi:hypothetical protein
VQPPDTRHDSVIGQDAVTELVRFALKAGLFDVVITFGHGGYALAVPGHEGAMPIFAAATLAVVAEVQRKTSATLIAEWRRRGRRRLG